MNKYVYKARDGKGKLVEGVIDANSSREVVNILHNNALIAVAIDEVKEDVKKKKKKRRKEIAVSRRITPKDIAIFCRQMATLINAGVSVVEAVEDICQMSSNLRLKKVLGAAVANIKTGSALSDALGKHPKVFNKVFVSMIKAGEESGNLDTILRDLAGYLENSVKLKRKIQSASMYPLLIAGFMFLIVAAMVLFLVPQFKKLFASMGADLPLPTQIVMVISDTMVKNVHWAILSFIGIIMLANMTYRTKPGRYQVDSMLLKIPIFGIIIKKVILTRFFQTLATLLHSGVNIITSMEIVAKVINNALAEKVVDNIRVKIMQGSTLSAEMGQYTLFPTMTVKMTSVGEKSGKLDEVMEKISEYYNEEVDAAVDGFSSIIEPVLVVMLGGVVGIFVVCMYLPVFKMAMAMSGGF